MAVHIRETTFGSVLSVGKLFMIQSQQVKYGGMEVVDVDLVLDRFVSKFICGSECKRRFDAGSHQPGGEALDVMVAPC